MVGSLYVPETVLDRYPTSGWVWAVGPGAQENLQVGDYVLIEEEGLSVDRTYYDVFELTLKHDDGFIESIFVEIEVEPVVRETVSEYRRAGVDTFIKTVDKKNGGSIGFHAHNVVSWQFGQVANPAYNLTYVPVHMYYLVNEDDKLELFYLTSEKRILATVEYQWQST